MACDISLMAVVKTVKIYTRRQIDGLVEREENESPFERTLSCAAQNKLSAHAGVRMGSKRKMWIDSK